MAKKPVDNSAAKAKKQKIVLVVAGVLLLGLAAFQLPKLMHREGTPPPAPLTSPTASSPDNPNGVASVAAGAPVVPAASTSGTTAAPAAVVVTGKPGAVVAGVSLPGPQATHAASNQLISFTMFKSKDPFVPGVNDTATGAPASPGTGSTGPSGPSGPSGASGGAGASTTDGGTPAPPPAKIEFATINLNGAPQQIEVKGSFPEKSPLFVLRSLDKRSAKIGVAGGSFDDSQAVTLPFGKTITLVNTATGVRYELKLVYTGSTPEVIEGFSKDNQRSSGDASTASTNAGGS